MAGRDGGLRVLTQCAAELLGAAQGGKAAGDEQVIPARAILVGEQYRLAVRSGARP